MRINYHFIILSFVQFGLSEQTFKESHVELVSDFTAIEILEPAINQKITRSIAGCLSVCMMDAACLSFSYNKETGQCNVFDLIFSDQNSVTQQQGTNWTYYKTQGPLLALPTTTTVPFCQTNECYSYGSSWYQVFNEALIWDDAQSVCAQYGGKLAEAETPEENNFIKSVLQTLGGNRYFIGGFNYNVDATFEWASDPNTPISYSDWEPGQPNTPETSHCLYSNSQYQYRWGDITCTLVYPFICEF